MIIDPWENKELILQEGINLIKGVYTKKNKDNISSIRHIIEFNYYYDSLQKYYILCTINKTNDYNNIELKLFEDIAIIENISKSELYRGSEYMLLALQIIFKLNYKKSELTDMAYFKCNRKINFFSDTNNVVLNDMEIYNKLIYLFKYEKTFYMFFGYIPVIHEDELIKYDFKNIIIYNNKNNEFNNFKDKKLINLSNTINKLLNDLKKITWNDINLYLDEINNILNTNKLKNTNKIFNFRIYNYNKWKKYWLNIHKSWNIFYLKFSNDVDTPFQAFSSFNKEECNIFINWLELYSFSVEQTIPYDSSIFNNNINNNLKILAGINDFKTLKLILNKCNWINNNIIRQPLNSIFIK